MLDGKDHRFIMASLDVESLFTNIPLDETIEIVTNKVFEKKNQVNGLYRTDFKKLLTLSTKGTVFLFNGHYYRQKDGVAMGSPLGPALANVFLCHYETTWLDECPLSFAPIFFARYIDDIFVLLRSREHIVKLAEYMSSRHPNIRFTYEEESNNVLPFLDVNVFRDADRLSSTVHRKDTFSGVYTNYSSFIPEMYKKGLVSTLLHRAYQISSSHTSIHQEVEKLKKIFGMNGYPTRFVDKCIRAFFNKIYEKRDPLFMVPKREFTMFLPFLGNTSLRIKNSLTRSFNELMPFCKVKLIFKSSRKLSSCFMFKDKIPESLMSGVIYQFNCSGCTSSYIGSTKRYWETRLQEHLHISALTGQRLNGLQVFSPMQHCKCCPGASISRDDFKIIGRDSNPYVLQVKESIFIKTKRPQLNNNMISVPLHLFMP